MIENIIDQNMMSLVGNIEMPHQQASVVNDMASETTAVCIVITIICAN